MSETDIASGDPVETIKGALRSFGPGKPENSILALQILCALQVTDPAKVKAADLRPVVEAAATAVAWFQEGNCGKFQDHLLEAQTQLDNFEPLLAPSKPEWEAIIKAARTRIGVCRPHAKELAA